MRRTPLALIAVSILQSVAVAADVMHRLKDQEITARLTGMEITDEYHWAYVFGPDGKLSSVSLGKAGTGNWRVQDDELCLERGVDALRCYEVWIAGRKVELRREGSPSEEAILQKPQKRK